MKRPTSFVWPVLNSRLRPSCEKELRECLAVFIAIVTVFPSRGVGDGGAVARGSIAFLIPHLDPPHDACGASRATLQQSSTELFCESWSHHLNTVRTACNHESGEKLSSMSQDFSDPPRCTTRHNASH